MLDVRLQLSTAEMFADTEPKIYKRHCVKSVWVHTTTFHLQHNHTLVISLQTASLTEPTVQYVRNSKPWQRRLFATSPHRHGDATGKPETRNETRGCKKTSISCETSSNFDIFHTLSNRLECHKVPRLPRKTTWQPAWKHSKRTCFPASPIDTATPQEKQRATRATQNNMTTSLETFEKERFSSFPHRHGDATEKQTTRDKTRACRKTSIFCETSGNFPSWQHDKKTSFAASPIDTARPRENQTCETRQVGAPKRAFLARLPPIFTLCSFKIDVFLRVFLRTWKFATSKSMFRARLSSIFSTSHKMPRLPRNVYLVATGRSTANAICKKHATRHV